MLPVITLLALITCTTPAMAQFGGQAGFAEAFQRDFFRRDMQLFVDYLRLEDWQKPIIEVLLDDYQVSFDAGTEACKDRMANLKDEMLANPDDAMEIALRPIKEWEVEKKQIRDDFINNLRTQLSPLQMERWPSLERAMRREKELPLGEIPGESMNVFAVLHGMELSPDVVHSIDPILLTYETNLDAVLDQRRNQMDKYQPMLQDAMVSRDYQKGLSGLRNIVNARNQVCETHLLAIEELFRAMPPELGDEFRTTVLGRGYPDIFTPNSIDRLLEAARRDPTLTPEQVAELDQIEAEYLVAIEQSDESLLLAYLSNGLEIPVLEAKRAIARRNKEPVERGGAIPTQIQDLKTARQKMIDEFRARILAVLTPEQSAKIPAAAKFDRRSSKMRDRFGDNNGTISPNGGRPSAPRDTQGPANQSPKKLREKQGLPKNGGPQRIYEPDSTGQQIKPK